MRLVGGMLMLLLLVACATPQGSAAGSDEIQRGRYLTELLGCAACHTDGLLIPGGTGGKHLAGSTVGIAYSAFREGVAPAVVFPANITPDEDTGVGRWSRAEIIRNVRFGIDRHGRQQLPIMPWPGYAHMSESDAGAIASYLMSLPPVKHEVPDNIAEGESSPHRYIRYGIYLFEPGGTARQVGQPARH